MKYYTILIILVLLNACQSSDSPSYYFDTAKQDSLVVQMIAYIGPNASQATDSTRLNPEFKSEYAKSLPNYQLVKLVKNKEGKYFYFMIRPVANLLQYRRGVIGSFLLDEKSGKILSFKEEVNTPHLKEDVVKERGEFLFREYVTNGNLNEYLAMKDYVEWPDSSLKYNKHLNRWVIPNGKF